MNATAPDSAADSRLQALAEALDSLTDPEIPVVTLREMGILRQLRQAPDGQIEVVITPTYSGCPAMEQIQDDISATLQRLGLRGRVLTQLAPAWTTDWMSPAARQKLRDWGIAPPQASACALGHSPEHSPVHLALHRPAPQAIACPQCGSLNTTETSHFGSTACKALYRCLDCMEPFDYFKPL